MQISNAPPPDLPAARTPSAAGAEQAPQSPLAPLAADRADIRPLDAQAALLILVAEVRASLDTFLLASLARTPAGASGTSAPESATQAAQQLLELFLRALPPEEDAQLPGDIASPIEPQAQVPAGPQIPPPPPIEPQQWLDTVAQLQAAVDASADSALRTISAWRDVPPPVVEVARDAHVMLQMVLAEEPQSPLWLRPEWLGLAPRMQQFWRRRRRMRRRLSDPDYPSGHLDDLAEPYQ